MISSVVSVFKEADLLNYFPFSLEMLYVASNYKEACRSQTALPPYRGCPLLKQHFDQLSLGDAVHRRTLSA